MRKFAFRLETILGNKEALERAVQVELAELQIAHREATMELRALSRQQLEQLQQMAGQQRQRSINVPRVANYAEYLTGIERQIKEQEEVLRQLGEQIGHKREELTERMKEKKVLVKLKERQESAHLEEVQRSEEQRADEVVITSLSRSKMSGGGGMAHDA